MDGVIGMNMEVTHADLSKISGMIFVKVDSVMMLASSVSATSRMLAMFANAAMTMRNVSSELPGLLFVGAHVGFMEKKELLISHNF